MSTIIPRPAREIIFNPLNISSMVNKKNRSQGEAAIIGIFGGGALVLPPAEQAIKAAIRVSVAAIGASILFSSGGSMLIGGLAGAFISFPSVTIATGSFALAHGVTDVVASIASGSFEAFVSGAFACGAGWLSLEYHDAIPYGIAENLIQYAGKSLAPKLVGMLCK